MQRPRATSDAQPPADRREALKFHNRQAILDAAAALAEEHGLGGFTVNDLAERAGVSRRTIFNHFASVEDAVHARVSELLGVIVDDFVAVAEATPPATAPNIGAVFEQLVTALELTDLVPPLSRTARLVGGNEDHPATVLWSHDLLQTLTARLTVVITDHHPEADAFTVSLLASSLLNGLSVAFEQWHAETGAVDSPESRVVWQRLLRTTTGYLRRGFAA